MFINNISASRSDIIDQCLWKYNLRYNLKLPAFANPNEESLNFGSYIHKIFELGYNSTDIKDIYKISEEQKTNYKIPFSLKSRTEKCIENFYKWNSSIAQTLSTERMFEVPLDEKGDIKLIGVIDRVILSKEGNYLVVDYKTSKKEKGKADLQSDKQLMGYAYAIHTEYKVPYNKIWCAHYYPVTNNLVPVQFNPVQIHNWRKREIEKVWRIRKKTKDDFPAQQNIFCDWCEYKTACPIFNTQAEVCARIDEAQKKKKELDLLKEVNVKAK
jgi:ATP-dependent helicase/DNAse subunit B